MPLNLRSPVALDPLTPLLLLLLPQLLLFTATPAIMGTAFVTSALTSAVTWLIALMVVTINAWAVYEAAISTVSRSGK